MALGLVGKKLGMTRVFSEDGSSSPVTVIMLTPNRVVRVLDKQRDGYRAVQLSAGEISEKHLSRAEAGHFAKHGVRPGSRLCEFRLEEGEKAPADDGVLTVGAFSTGQKICVTGVSKGKGFQSGIRRWNFRGQDNTHGNSKAHRNNGAIGQCQTPGKVWKGKKMSGQMGNARVTVSNLGVVRIDEERNLLLVKGAVPGANDAEVLVRPMRGFIKLPSPAPVESEEQPVTAIQDGAGQDGAGQDDTKQDVGEQKVLTGDASDAAGTGEA